MMYSTPALQRRLSDIVEEYDKKLSALDNMLADYQKACGDIKLAATIGGTYGGRIDTSDLYKNSLERSLLKSAWRYVYDGLNLRQISSASDRKEFEQAIEGDLAPFTLENISATFGDYLLNPRLNILRGLAEVFCSLDPAYKSHDKVKFGVEGLPKRIILSNLTSYGYGWGAERLADTINALAAYQGKPFIEYEERSKLFNNEYALKDSRGIRLRRFKNGNGHLFFEPAELQDINKALAEFYGDILADTEEEKPTKKQQSTALSKDLQYYPTPEDIVESIVANIHIEKGTKILEPSCGCGRFMDALIKRGAKVFGIEFDSTRAEICRKKGHSVLQANFLETVPIPEYDKVIMNPPFYGRHYAKHVSHALKFLKPGGTLTAILPITARYDHGLLSGHWNDLPVGSFAESGTNINTTVLTMRTEEAA